MVETVTQYKFTTAAGRKMSCLVTYDDESGDVERFYYDKDGNELVSERYKESGAVYLEKLEAAAAIKGEANLHKQNRSLLNFLKARL